MHIRFMQSVLALVVVFAMVFCQGTWVLAGTTGSITGTVTDQTTKNAVAGAKVTASSPSQNATATTDGSGHFALLSLSPDTYTLSVEKAGREPLSISGITVQSDQNLVQQLVTNPVLQTIGRVTSRSSGSLVRSGVTADVYNVTPAQQVAAAPLGGGTNLNAAYSAIASIPGTLVPIASSGGWGQSVNIRGGDYTQTGFELDGIPINRAFDQYSGSPLSNLGNQEVQVYTGGQPADAQANGLAGFVNQVIRTGTTPGFTNSQFGLGAPGNYHKFSFESGGATANRNFSYYAGFLGYNQDNRIIDQFNGIGFTPLYGTTINYIAQNCAGAHPSVGCYQNGPNSNLTGGLPIGPNGYVTAPTYWGFVPSIADREGTVNLHIGLPHPHDGLKDDIQLLYNTGKTYNTPNASLSAFGSALPDVLNGTAFNGAIPNGDCTMASATPIACASGVTANYIDQNFYSGPLNARLTAANIGQIRNSRFAGSESSYRQGYNGLVPQSQVDTETTGFAVEKVQYQHNLSSNAYARVYGYSFYSDRIDNGIVGLCQNFAGTFSPDYKIRSHTRGVAALFADQIDAHNLLSFNAAYSYSNTTRDRNDTAAGSGFAPVAYLVNSLDPTGGCYNAAGRPVGCTARAAAKYVLPPVGGSALVPTGASPVIGTETALTCGTGPCEYLAVNSGQRGALNSVRPAFTNAAISDTIKPNDRLTLTGSLRFEDFTYNLAETNTLGNRLFVSDYNNSHCVQGTTVTTRAFGVACPAGFVAPALTAASPARLDYGHIFSPRFGFTYSLDPNTVLRGSYGRYTQPAETSAVDATNVQAGAPSSQFYTNFGFPSYARSVEPEISYNTDFSIERAMPRADLQLKVTPFYRQSTNEFISILVDPKTNFIANINGLNRKTSGIELAVTKGNFNRDGFAAQLAYTYTHAEAKYKVFPNGGSFVAQANSSIQAYNGYTQFCAQNPTSKQCPDPALGQVAAAPCYAGGAADPTCTAAMTVANPYWKSQAYGLLDPNAAYVPFNQNIGLGAAGIATSYIVPHVAALILNYKKGPLSITPSFQFQGGSRYGSPLVAQGVAPDTCGGLTGGVLAGDRRYAAGTPAGGLPYDASSCTGLVAIPNPQSGRFDGVGDYVQPNLLATNLSLNYDFSKKLGINVIAANILNRCFGGSKAPWLQGNIGCAYGQAGTYVANLYNPGDAIQPYAQHSYTPITSGALQSVSASSPLPFELYVNLNLHI